MNRYSLWKNFLLLAVVIFGLIYASPNLYRPDPAVQIASRNSGLLITEQTLSSIRGVLDKQDVKYFGDSISDDKRSALIRFENQQEQLKGIEFIQASLGEQFVVALNLAPTTPQWLRDLGATPMKLGLDLSGGVHFLLEVDTKDVVNKRLDGLQQQIPDLLVDEKIRFKKVSLEPNNELHVIFRSVEPMNKAKGLLRKTFPTITFVESADTSVFSLIVGYTAEEVKVIEEEAIKKNITALRNRVNELGVSEPIVQRQGRNRIIVQLPGIQDTAEAKRIIGKTANLEFRLEYSPSKPKARDRYEFISTNAGVGTAQLERSIITSGDMVADASTGFDENGRPQVNIRLTGKGGKLMNKATYRNIGRRMGVLFLETKSKLVDGEVESYVDKKIISLATIQSALGVSFRITGAGSQAEASELALLLRAGALAAPMIFVEERTVGPSLGAENIADGVTSIQWGIGLVLLFMLIYYRLFGLFANVALTLNVILLSACMSLLGATLTLPGIAGIVLTLGMSVDANVLIFARIREEIAKGSSVQMSIEAGFERAFSTILDANITTLIVAAILYLIGSGPIQGFAVTLSIGILTSMFTAIMGTRAMVNLAYGGRKNVTKLSI